MVFFRLGTKVYRTEIGNTEDGQVCGGKVVSFVLDMVTLSC